jgi:hypothetical protein
MHYYRFFQLSYIADALSWKYFSKKWFQIFYGTIDKVYNASTGELAFVKTHIIDMLNRSRSMADTLSEVLFLKDSLETILYC